MADFADVAASTRGRETTALDLARLRDIGRSDTGTDQEPAVGISPGGRRLAFVVRQARPDSNLYCQSLVMTNANGIGRPTTVALLGQPARISFDLRGLWMPTGLFAVNRPKWSPDGRSIAYLSERRGVTQAFIVDVRRGTTAQATRSLIDVERVGWTTDGRGLVFATRPSLGHFHARTAEEARSGYLADARIWPAFSAEPLPPAEVPLETWTVAEGSVRARRASASERAELAQGEAGAVGGGPAIPVRSAAAAAWVAPVTAGSWEPALRLYGRTGDLVQPCDWSECVGRLSSLVGVGSGDFVYLRREGWAGSLTAVYRWSPGSRPRRILATEDLLLGCQPLRRNLLCGLESSLRPRRLVTIGADNGAVRTVFDPNPEFAAMALPGVVRLHWRAAMGVEAFGDLVVPRKRESLRPLPLVVVQYRTRGFLRGAIGDEFPILPLAARGFAVLSLEKPPEYSAIVGVGIANLDEAMAINIRDWSDRRLIQSSLEAGVHAAAERIPIDQERLGITGLSDGAATAWFALINTQMFAAGSLSTPAFDPATILPSAGPALADELRRFGYPREGDPAPAFWTPVSPALNAAKIGVPLLLQYSDDEYQMGVEYQTAARDAGAPSEFYVFPGEHHVKWQPAHRLAIYERNLDWFDFWLQDREHLTPAKGAQYARWRALRVHGCQAVTRSANPAPVIPIQLCSQASTSTSSDILR